MAEITVVRVFDTEMLANIRELYLAAKWLAEDDDWSFLGKALQNSACVVAALENGRVIGIGRALSDGCSDAYIQDVVVSPAFRKRGIGAMIIRELEKELRSMGVDWIGLVGEPGTEKFYASLGLERKENFTLWRFPDRGN